MKEVRRPSRAAAEAFAFRPVSSRNAFEETVERLAQAVKLGLVRQGERLPPERELAPRLGVSRVTLREAIRALEQGGYVRSRRGRAGGTFVVHPLGAAGGARVPRDVAREMGDGLVDALDLRRVIEPGAAELAAERAGPGDAERLRALVRAVAESPSAEYRAADARLHLAFAEVAGTHALVAAVADVQMRLTDLLAAIPRLEKNISHANRQHDAVVRAVAAGDPAAARAAMAEHVEGTANLLRGFLG